MHLRSFFVILSLFLFLTFGYGQATTPGTPAGPTTPASAVNILAPKPGAKLTTNFVQVQYDIANASSASSSPTFRLRLDARDPVDTTETTYTFTGLAPGTHSVSITVIDANGVPVSGTQNEVKFTVAAAPAPSAAPPLPKDGGTWVTFNLVPRAEAASTEAVESGDADMVSLVLWLICGIIIGGIIAAAKTRSAGP